MRQESSESQTASRLSLISVAAELPSGARWTGSGLVSGKTELIATSQNELSQSVSNLAGTYANLLAQTPSEFASKLKSDCLNKPGATALKLAESAALGLGTAVLLAKSPVLAKTILAGAGIGASALAIDGSIRFTSKALKASSPEDQARLALEGSKTLGGLAADILETSPSLLLGSAAGLKLANRVPTLSSISTAVRDFGELRARRLVPEGIHYLSMDAKSVTGIGSAETAVQAAAHTTQAELNLLKAGQEMMQKTPWRGMEEGRFFKASGADSIKMSARLPGTESEVYMGKRSQQMFHTHEKQILPTSGDFNTVYGTGVVAVPGKGVLTFYEGSGREAERIVSLLRTGQSEGAAKASEALHGKTFKTVVVDPTQELSVRVDLRWNSNMNGMMPTSIRPLDYADTVQNLSKWKGRINFDSMQASAEALRKPGMTELIASLAGKS